MLTVRNLHVSYKRIQAVRGVSLEVSEGEFVGIIGPNGAGKSSTLHAIVGVVRPTEGEVLYEGCSLRDQAPEEILRRGISLVPEGRQVFARLTVEENLRLGASSVGKRATISKALQGAFERFPILEKYRASPAGRLSGGEQQQLVIGRALVTRPKLLMLDEPSLGLAPLVVGDVFRILEELRHEGVTILLVEQNAARTIAIADRVWVMSNGKAEPLALEALTREQLISAYLGTDMAE